MKPIDTISRNRSIAILLLLLLIAGSSFVLASTIARMPSAGSKAACCDVSRRSPADHADDVVERIVIQDPQQERKRCKAITQEGTQCKRDAKEGKEYCWQHGKVPAGERCKAITKKGTQCSRKAKSSAGYCTQHEKMRE